MTSLFQVAGIPSDVITLLYTIAIIMIAAFFVSDLDLGIFKIPNISKRSRGVSLTFGVLLLGGSVVSGLKLIPTTESKTETKTTNPCNEKLPGLPGVLHGLNDIGLIDTYSSTVVRGSDMRLGLTLRADIDQSLLSCVRIDLCRPTSPNSCATVTSRLFPVRGIKNIFTIRIGDNYQVGAHKVILKLVQVQHASDLNGGSAIADYKLFGETRDFQVR